MIGISSSITSLQTACLHIYIIMFLLVDVMHVSVIMSVTVIQWVHNGHGRIYVVTEITRV